MPPSLSKAGGPQAKSGAASKCPKFIQLAATKTQDLETQRKGGSGGKEGGTSKPLIKKATAQQAATNNNTKATTEATKGTRRKAKTLCHGEKQGQPHDLRASAVQLALDFLRVVSVSSCLRGGLLLVAARLRCVRYGWTLPVYIQRCSRNIA